MAGSRNHAPLEQLLDEIKFQRRQVVWCSRRNDIWHVLKAGKSWEASARTPDSPSPITQPTGPISLSGIFSFRSPIMVISCFHSAHLFYSNKRSPPRTGYFVSQIFSAPGRHSHRQRWPALLCQETAGKLYSNCMMFKREYAINVKKIYCNGVVPHWIKKQEHKF